MPDDVRTEDWEEISQPISQFEERFHPGGAVSLRSKPTAGGHTNQCIYDGNGKLITEPPTAGTADRRDPGHFPDDVDPVVWAAILDGMWDGDGGPLWLGRITRGVPGRYVAMYYEKRPPLHMDCERNGVQ